MRSYFEKNHHKKRAGGLAAKKKKVVDSGPEKGSDLSKVTQQGSAVAWTGAAECWCPPMLCVSQLSPVCAHASCLPRLDSSLWVLQLLALRQRYR
jgi:hypothetical protein